MKTQTQRVLAALKAEGSRGITAVDFAAPHVWDDGPPIMRVAARINELRLEGHNIVDGGTRDGVKVYRLVSAPAAPAAEQPPAEGTDALFDAPKWTPPPRIAVYDDAA